MKTKFALAFAELALLSMLGTVSASAADLSFATQEFPPFAYLESGKAAGPLVEVVKAVCAAAQKDCTVEVLPWRRAVDDAESGRIQAIFPVLDVPERRAKFYLSPPIVKSVYSFYAADGEAFSYANPKDIKGLRIGVYGPSATSIVAEDIAKEAGGAQIALEIDNATVLRKLAAGRYGDHGLGLLNRDVASHLQKVAQISGVKAVGDASPILYTIAFSKAGMSEADAQALNSALNTLIQSGKVKEIDARFGLVGP